MSSITDNFLTAKDYAEYYYVNEQGQKEFVTKARIKRIAEVLVGKNENQKLTFEGKKLALREFKTMDAEGNETNVGPIAVLIPGDARLHLAAFGARILHPNIERPTEGIELA